MSDSKETLIEVILQQAEIFLLDAKEFYPFGTYITLDGEIVPVGGYLESEELSPKSLIELLENSFKNARYIIAGLGVDIAIKENGESYDAIEIRFFEPQKECYRIVFKYSIGDNSVKFIRQGNLA